ncbi:MAG: pyridoxine 5'-phosphate synthase [Myxococcota bacterium]
MRRLVLILDSLPVLRSAANASEVDVKAAATLAELAAVDAVRLGVNDDLLPVSEQDVADVRRAVRTFELGMSVSPTLIKVALEAQPDRVVLGLVGRDGGLPSQPVDLRGRGVSLAPTVRSLADAGIPVSALVRPELDAVKTAHSEGVDGVEFFTGLIVDLPAGDRARELEALGDASRLASKLGMHIAASGELGYRTLSEVIEHAPAVASVAVGRAIVARALLVGLDRAVRDLRALLG